MGGSKQRVIQGRISSKMIQETESKQKSARMVDNLKNSENILRALEQDVLVCRQTLHNQGEGESQC